MLHVLIADDEPPARKRLRRLLKPMEDAGRLTVAAEAGDGVDTLERLREQPIDLLFLDIRMPGLDGFEVLERLEPTRRPIVVFTTAYDDYAVRAFEANAIDYLLKPVSRARLEDAVGRAERLHRTPTARPDTDERLAQLLDWVEAQQQQARPAETAPPEYLRQLSIPVRDRILVVPVERVVSAEIQDGITRVYVLDEDMPGGKAHLRPHVVNYTLDQLEANLSPQDFMRVHRSALVRLEHIRELIAWFSGRYKLAMTGGHEVIASRERSRQLKERLLL
ncbi:DNA-binding response regulator [Rhodothermaceae bacterium RA]|nr:DNA-binding response regulator [Rhodothermaceae bacterium RA]